MRPLQALSAIALAATLAVASIALQSCGGGNGDNRDLERCDVCDGHVIQDCFHECVKFCLPDDPDCQTRCTRQCDQCKKDLRCVPCNGSCTTNEFFRCAPIDEVITCEDGTFGGSDTSATPHPTETPVPTSTAATPAPTSTAAPPTATSSPTAHP